MSNNISNCRLYNEIMSDENIFSAIYSMPSYIFERNLLSNKDLKCYYRLHDKYNDRLIKKLILKCKNILENIMQSPDIFFDISVHFKAKKYNNKTDEVECRPIHSANLITQICIVSLLNVLMFKKNKDGKRVLSDLSQLLPANFYGNLPSDKYEYVFYDWKEKYKSYTENVINEFNVAKDTNKYKYEVCLDLKNYFPSVSPNFIYDYIIDKCGNSLGIENISCLQTVLEKLLYFNVNNLNKEADRKKYYGDNLRKINFENKYYPNVGLPQGLPQAYFFGNIAMVVIAYEFEKKFPGKSFYYVDDSVIYTNSESANTNNFEKTLKDLNCKISEAIAKFVNAEKSTICCVHNEMIYKVEVHSPADKSTSVEVADKSTIDRVFLMPLTLGASRVSAEINSSFLETQDIATRSKIETLLEGVKAELKFVKDKEAKLQNEPEHTASIQYLMKYKKILQRYKKFFLYRMKLIDLKLGEINDDIDHEISEFEKKYFFNCTNLTKEQKQSVFEIFDEDIFLAEAQMLYSLMLDKHKRNDFKNKIKEFELALLQDVSDNSLYFYHNFKVRVYFTDRYTTLKRKSKDCFGNSSRNSYDIKIKQLIKLLNTESSSMILKNCESQQDEKTNSIWLMYGKTYDKYIFKHSDTYKRKILNAVISNILNVDISDEIEISREDKRALLYYELRILAYIRNTKTKIDSFIEFIQNVLREYSRENYEKIDFSIYEVMQLFIDYVKEPLKIDHLILAHKYVSSLWKNGSKYLYFYTLHNQEHSVELIKLTVHICKTIDYFQIKNTDYFVLFLACYLHDISMVIHPDINVFSKDDPKSDEIYTCFIDHVGKLYMSIHDSLNDDRREIKQLLKDFYNKMNEYFEALVRDNHATDSSLFIKFNPLFSFIEPAIKENVATVSEAHGYSYRDVYGVKSNAKTDIVSVKYLMILLRIADLLDISKDRVSLNILNQNINSMPNISRYHWVTHAAIDKYEITVKYRFNNQDDCIEKSTCLLKENFIETITVELFLNTSNLLKVKSLDCKDAKARIQDSSIVIDIGNGLKCENDTCNFLCKWMLNKNSYLLTELNALNQYLERNSNNMFSTHIQIKINFENAQVAPQNHIDIVNSQISN